MALRALPDGRGTRVTVHMTGAAPMEAGAALPLLTLVESMSDRVHATSCFHIVRRPGAVYKVLFPEATREQAREYIEVKNIGARCCGSCLSWAVPCQ